ncbi:MAG: metalloregulator ArsR/SmtB family transcription factor [Rhodanobacteraceae bacterium]
MDQAVNSVPALPDMTLIQERAEEASQLLKSLGNAHRLRILCLLVDGEMTVGQINGYLPDLSQSALSQHLGRLRDRDLVSTRREAQTIWYALRPGPSQRVMLALHNIYCETRIKTVSEACTS